MVLVKKFMNLYLFQKMKKNNSVKLLFIFFVVISFSTHNLYSINNPFISFLETNGHKLLKVNSFIELENKVNNIKKYDGTVVFLEKGDTAIGFIYFKESNLPNFFICDSSNVSFFSSNSLINDNDERFFSLLLNNIYSIYQIDLKNKKIDFLIYGNNFSLKYSSINIYSVKRKKYTKFEAKTDFEILSPTFKDTLNDFKVNDLKKYICRKKKIETNLIANSNSKLLSMFFNLFDR